MTTNIPWVRSLISMIIVWRIHLGVCGAPLYKTCLEAKEKGETVNRTFLMQDDAGMTFDVYCEFGLQYGFSFLSNTILSKLSTNIENIIPNDTTFVSLRMMYSNGTQAETLIEQLPENDKIPLGIFMTGHQNYQSSFTCSIPYMKQSPNYLYIGMLSSNDMQYHARGYQANGKPYRTKGNEPNSACHFTIFFNSQCVSKVNIKNVLKNSTMNGWYENAKPVHSNVLPSELFFQAFIVSCLGSQDLVTYNSYGNTEIAIGLPFGMLPKKQPTTTEMQTTTTEIQPTTTEMQPNTPEMQHTTTEMQLYTTEMPTTVDEATTASSSTNTTVTTDQTTSDGQSTTMIQDTLLPFRKSTQRGLIVQTTSSTETTKEKDCMCLCPNRRKYLYLTSGNLTRDQIKDALQDELDKLKTAIEVPKRNTSAYVRSKTCDRSDRRISSQAIGTLSVVLMVIPMTLFLLNDVTTVWQLQTKMRVVQAKH